jgi:hypothetical protein
MDQGAAMRPALFFLGWARPKSYKLQARKLSSLTGSGLWDIMGFKNERKK